MDFHIIMSPVLVASGAQDYRDLLCRDSATTRLQIIVSRGDSSNYVLLGKLEDPTCRADAIASPSMDSETVGIEGEPVHMNSMEDHIDMLT
jgi:hypothetical protein